MRAFLHRERKPARLGALSTASCASGRCRLACKPCPVRIQTAWACAPSGALVAYVRPQLRRRRVPTWVARRTGGAPNPRARRHTTCWRRAPTPGPCAQVGRRGLRAPVHITLAAHKMGQLEMYDQYLSRHAAADFDTWDLDDVDAAFGAASPVKFQQRVALTGAPHLLG